MDLFAKEAIDNAHSKIDTLIKSAIRESDSSKNNKGNIVLSDIDTPLGPIIACANKEGICLLEFADKKMLQLEFKYLSQQLNAAIVPGENLYFERLNLQLEEYFKGDRKTFTVPISTFGSPFQQKVWEKLQEIPYGKIWSYNQQAKALGKPEAVRAVANANGLNRIVIIIPCHRVIGSNGNLTGYSGGLWRKEYLLELEQNHL